MRKTFQKIRCFFTKKETLSERVQRAKEGDVIYLKDNRSLQSIEIKKGIKQVYFGNHFFEVKLQTYMNPELYEEHLKIRQEVIHGKKSDS